MFDDVAGDSWYITKEMMNLELKKIPKDFEKMKIDSIKGSIDPLIMIGFLYALFRLDQRSSFI